jgi:acyl carrier protein
MIKIATRDLVTEKCKQYCVKHFSLKLDDCHEMAYFDDWGADDLDRVELIIFAEDAFEIEFSDQDIDCRVITFGAFVDLIEAKMKESK